MDTKGELEKELSLLQELRQLPAEHSTSTVCWMFQQEGKTGSLCPGEHPGCVNHPSSRTGHCRCTEHLGLP